MKAANWLIRFMVFSFVIFLWSCAESGDGSGAITQKLIPDEEVSSEPSFVEDITTTEPNNTVELNSSISIPAASLVIRVVGNNLPTTSLTATVLGTGNSCGEYKLSSGFAQTSTEVQLDAPFECFTSSINNASQIRFNQLLQDVAVVALQNEGEAKEFDTLASGTIGSPSSDSLTNSRSNKRNFTENQSDDVIDLWDVIYLFAYFQGTRDSIENLTAAGQNLLSDSPDFKPATVMPNHVFDNFTESPTDKVVDLVDVVYLFAFFQSGAQNLVELETAAKSLLPTLDTPPTVLPKATGFETNTLASPVINADAGSLVIRVTGSDLPTTGWKAAIAGNDCGGYKQASSFPHSSTEILLDAPIECLYNSLTNVSQVTFNYPLNEAVVTVQVNEGGGNYRTLGSSVSSDITSPANASISINGGSDSTTNPVVALSLSATDNEYVAAYYLSESSETPNVTSSDWVPLGAASTPNYFSNNVSFVLNSESASGSYAKTVYAWFKDNSDNLSSSVSDSITLVVEETTPASPPVHPAAGIVFVDTDLQVGELAGNVVITKASDESDITDYVLYWGLDSSTKLLPAIATIPKAATDLTYSLPDNTTIPIDESNTVATHLLVYTKNSAGEMSSGMAHQFTDAFIQTGHQLQVVAGVEHSCVTLDSGNIKCWGKGTDGRLGNGSNADSSTPVSVSGIDNAVQISLRSRHSCAVLSDGKVKCWGKGGSGRLGNNSTSDSNVPVEVNGIGNAIQVSVGKSHSCALLNDGNVKCWGHGNAGRLGNNTTKKSTIPVTVNGINSAVHISAGNAHTCAVLSDGTIKCWGKGFYQVLGNGSTENSSIPVPVDNISSAIEVSAGNFHSCALINDGSVRCWGRGSHGQLGDGNTPNYSAPVTVSGLSSAVEVSAGGFHTCARLSDGTAKCWGRGSHGRLGNDSTKKSLRPVLVNSIGSVVGISAGSAHTCAITGAATIQCWGRGSHGRLGTGGTTNAKTPVYVAGYANVSIVDGLAASYSFEGNAYDDIGAFHGTHHGNVTYKSGKFGKAVDFDGSSYISTPLNGNLSTGEGFTISVWVNIDNNPSGITQIIEGFGSTSGAWAQKEIFLETINSSGVVQFDFKGNFINSPELTTGSWQHLVVTYDGSSQKVYVNGSLASEERASGPLTVVTGFNIGRDYEGNIQYFRGRIDELKLYNRAISLTDVQNLYNQ
ncbi:MAG: hypothetical protein HQM14_03875 [SAR324 cluster bacterium]|nr:hypothetical protein [SAR324 cluster bacterium]